MTNEQKLIRAIQTVAPGTELRGALDMIIAANNGALLVIGEGDKILSLSNGGFELQAEMSSQRLFELAKMDGAIILSKDANNIILANVHLVPDPTLPTTETGIRHRTAERVARQTSALVISISEQRGLITLFIDDIKYTLEDVRMVLAKANQAVQTLDKYKIRMDNTLTNLNALEFEDLVTLLDVTTSIQRIELVERIAKEITNYVYELGVNGRLMEMQLEESVGNIDREMRMLLEDYKKRTANVNKIRAEITKLSDDDILNLDEIAKIIGYKGYSDQAEIRLLPKGLRIMSRIPRIPDSVIFKLYEKFKTLEKLTDATTDDLDEVEGVGEIRARAIKEGLRRLREYNIIERYA